jgi:hypothetical protein
MGQFSVEIWSVAGSVLGGTQQLMIGLQSCFENQHNGHADLPVPPC